MENDHVLTDKLKSACTVKFFIGRTVSVNEGPPFAQPFGSVEGVGLTVLFSVHGELFPSGLLP